MNELDHAYSMMEMAGSDIKALQGMLELDNARSFFTDEVFGFHAQQAVEKLLKARISSLGGVYAKTHDIMNLLNALSDLGEETSEWKNLVDLNSFAVQYRYEAVDLGDEELDREELLSAVDDLYLSIKNAISEKYNK